MNTLFVTSSGTDVGKTEVCCRLIRELDGNMPLRVVKPVASGFDPAAPEASDAARLLSAQGRAADAAAIDAVSPWRFRAPLSPDMAAAREGKQIPFDALVEFSAAAEPGTLTLIEGIGGVMVPLDDRHTVLDWIAALDTWVLLVVGSYLGSLSHTLTALGMLRQRATRIAGIVVSESPVQPVPAAETAATIARFVPELRIAVLARAAPPAAHRKIVQPLLRGKLDFG